MVTEKTIMIAVVINIVSNKNWQ